MQQQDGWKMIVSQTSVLPSEHQVAEVDPAGLDDRFFRRGATRGEKIFARDSKGRVARMIDRRDNNDLIWRRTK